VNTDVICRPYITRCMLLILLPLPLLLLLLLLLLNSHSLMNGSLAGSRKSVGITDRAFIIYCYAKNFLCIKYHCFLH